jgi:uncharacterized membrane protein YkvA (DUF1232 family)
MASGRFGRWWPGRSRFGASAAPPERAASAAQGTPVEVEVIRAEDFVGQDSTRNERAVREGFLEKARGYLRYLPLAEEVVAAYVCMLDSRTPVWVKATVAGALAYFILPFDAVPDMLPLVGLNDDAAVITGALSAIASHLTDEHRRKARAWLRSERIEVGPSSSSVASS